MADRYWAQFWRRRASRRSLVGASTAMAGLAGATLVGCGGNNSPKATSVPATATRSGAAQPGSTAAPATAPPTQAAQPAQAASPAAAKPKRGGTYRIGTISYAPNFDPQYNGSSDRTRISSRLFMLKSGMGAVVSSATVPDVAQSYEQVDPTTLNVKLRPNAKFTAPVSRTLTAADVVFSWQRYTGQIQNVPPSANAGTVTRVFDAFKAVDDTTLNIALKQPQANVTYRLGNLYTPWIMPREAEKGYDPNKVAVGPGPYILDNAVTGSQLTYRRNPEWHLGPDQPYLDSIQEYTIPEYATRLTQFLGGNLDLMDRLSGNDIDRVKSNVKGVQFVLVPSGDPVLTTMVAFSANTQNAPWKDVRVRQAISMAFDREAMTQTAYDLKKLQSAGLDVKYVVNNFIPAALQDYWLDPLGTKIDPAAAKFFKYDPAGAKQLLAAAGFPNGFSGYALHYQNIFSASFNTMAELTVEYLSKIGINLTLTVDDYIAAKSTAYKGEFDGMYFISSNSYYEPGEFLTGQWVKGGDLNLGKIDDADVAQRITEIESNLNADSRRQQILDIQNYLATDKMYYVPMQAGSVPTISAFQPYMRNVQQYATIQALNDTWYWIDKG